MNADLASQRFRFRTRTIHATSVAVHDLHPNVLRLRLQPSILQQLFQSILAHIPASMKAWLASVFPEWDLPSRLILKKQKEAWDEEFETEKTAYTKLQAPQGTVIPRYFGEVSDNETKALLLSDIGGACLAEPDGALLEVDEFRRLLRQALTATSEFRILQDDTKLDNFHLVAGRIMVVDLERLREGLTDEKLELHIRSTINKLTALYEDNQYCFWEDGLITVDGQGS